jgi:hypothetical protein
MSYRRDLTRIGFAVFCVFLVSLLTGCPEDLETTSIRDRIAQFESDINNNRSEAYKNIHPDATQRDLYKDPSQWNSDFGTPGTYTHSFPNPSITNNIATATISSSDGSLNGQTATFTMKEDGEDNWKILKLEFSTSGIIIQISAPPIIY